MIEPQFLSLGDSALTLEFSREIDVAVNQRVLQLDKAIREENFAGFIESVPTYRSLLVQFNPLIFEVEAFKTRVLALLKQGFSNETKAKRWRVPVCYGGEYGWDLEEVASFHKLTPFEVIKRHSERIYRCYMVGFLPGFIYLGGLDLSIAMSRRTNPRAALPAGNISIGGEQALIASVEAPSGWYMLGRTPFKSFLPTRDPVFLIDAGDEVEFIPTPHEKWAGLEQAASAGDFIAELIS